MLVIIDQEEVICLLLWYIYYDLLLSYIQKDFSLGYRLSHKWSNDINQLSQLELNETIPDTAFIDDTTQFSGLHDNLKSILNIADSFYKFNDILINDDKAILLTNDLPSNSSSDVHFMINDRETVIKAKAESAAERVLSIWITFNKSDKHIIDHIKQEIRQLCDILRYKLIIDK